MAAGGGAAVGMAVAKCSIPFSVAVAKGVICNWLVCLAVWSAIASNSVVGKIFGIFLPISCFVALGAEHSIANMFIIPHGMFNGAAVSWSRVVYPFHSRESCSKQFALRLHACTSHQASVLTPSAMLLSPTPGPMR